MELALIKKIMKKYLSGSTAWKEKQSRRILDLELVFLLPVRSSAGIMERLPSRAKKAKDLRSPLRCRWPLTEDRSQQFITSNTSSGHLPRMPVLFRSLIQIL